MPIVKLLLKYKADPNLPTPKGMYPLQSAVLIGNVEIVELIAVRHVHPVGEHRVSVRTGHGPNRLREPAWGVNPAGSALVRLPQPDDARCKQPRHSGPEIVKPCFAGRHDG